MNFTDMYSAYIRDNMWLYIEKKKRKYMHIQNMHWIYEFVHISQDGYYKNNFLYIFDQATLMITMKRNAWCFWAWF